MKIIRTLKNRLNVKYLMKAALITILFAAIISCEKKVEGLIVSTDHLSLEFNEKLQIKYDSDLIPDKYKEKEFKNVDYIYVNKQVITQFPFVTSSRKRISGGEEFSFSGEYKDEKLHILKEVLIKSLTDYPNTLIKKVIYTNLSDESIKITSWINDNYYFPTKSKSENVWSFQPGTYTWRPDWVLPVTYGFSQMNYLGMNSADFGGGIPVLDVWNKYFGLAIGHTEIVPKLVYLPILRKSKKSVEVKVLFEGEKKLLPKESFETFETFLNVHENDYFHSLQTFSKIMQEKGFIFPERQFESYEPTWSTWGIGSNFTIEQVKKTLPKLKELGFKWIEIQDGWQNNIGDWHPNLKKFPKGDKDLRAFVDYLHAEGFLVKLWITPLMASQESKLAIKTQDLLLKKKKRKQIVSWWNDYYLCPAYPKTIEYSVKLVEKILVDWKFDGIKFDGQQINSVPECTNSAHNHKYKEESVESLPNYFKIIYETAHKINPNVQIELCPCGSVFSFYHLPFTNINLSSNPVSSWQIRLKGKTFNGILGEKAIYSGDNVELSDNQEDFASTIGIGGVVASAFILPEFVNKNQNSSNYFLTKEKEESWKKWLGIYNQNRLSEGKYRGELYDVAFDYPETHAVEKNDTMFYAFYSKDFDGIVEFKGLEEDEDYQIIDYVNNELLGKISGERPFLTIEVKDYLLVKAKKE